MSSCIDQNWIELIVRNVIAKLLQDHTLQAGLRSCEPSCGWLGHEVQVARCDQLPDVDAALEEFLCNEDFKACVRSVINDMWECGPFTEVTHDSTLTGKGTECSPLAVDPEALCFPLAAPLSRTSGTELPTFILGNRTALLGEPDGFMEICGHKVPYWD